ncbi:hypothetical protein [Solimonas soli]|uniref:hypothetical protein n=1 Tax=Solimonas soli TaxID=413479 RepID=UPI0004ADC789|nr:hypothetical protein [Solimonas soli]
MSIAILLAIVVSAVALLLLGRRDPKRLRAAVSSSLAPHTPAQRRALAALALAPGALLACAGQAAGFVIWLGAAVALGWLLTQMLAVGGRARRAHDAV